MWPSGGPELPKGSIFSWAMSSHADLKDVTSLVCRADDQRQDANIVCILIVFRAHTDPIDKNSALVSPESETATATSPEPTSS